MQTKGSFKGIILIITLVVLFVVNLSIGSVQIPSNQIFKILFGSSSSNPVWVDIIWDFRMTKALTCILAGSALSLGGLQMQTLFRNPLAGPDVLGLSSGASLAVSIIFMSSVTGNFIFQSPWIIAITASLGSGFVFFIMFTISKRLQDNVSLLIVGLMIGATTSSIVSVIQYLSKAEEIQTYLLWTFGSLGGLNWNEIQILTVALIVAVILALLNLKALNVWVLGDNYAKSLGVDLQRSRTLAILSASILTGAVTAFCGPIAFVGLAVPHLVKLLIQTNDHKILIPSVLVGGASLLLACDILAQLPSGPTILPINAITAMVGAPVVIWVIMRNKIVKY
jgi:iron complex transport system permease protein